MKHLSDSKGNILGYANPISGLVIEVISPQNPIRLKLSDASKYSFFTLVFASDGNKYEVSIKQIIENNIIEDGDYIYYWK